MNDLRMNLSEKERRGIESDNGLQQTNKSTPSRQIVSDGKPKIHDKKRETKRKKTIPNNQPIFTSPVRQCIPKSKKRIQVYTDNEPLAVEDDGDDELLLTSKGWDWDPLYVVLL